MALSILVNSVERVGSLQWKSLRITVTNGARAGRCDLVLVSQRAAIGVALVVADGATTYFSGTVRSIAIREVKEGNFYCTVSALDAGPAGSEVDAPFNLTDRDDETTYTDMVAAFVDTPYCWWRLGESSGTTAADEMGTQDGSYVNAPTLGAAGAMTTGDTAVTFNGTDEYVTVGAANLRGQVDFSIAAWFTSSSADALQVLYCERDTLSGALIRFYVNDDGRPVFQYRDDAGTLSTVTALSGDYTDGAWHHAAVTKDGTAVVIYIDGTEVRSATIGATDTLTGTMAANIGRDPYADDGHFPGSLDEVMIWRTWATAGEVLGLYQSRDLRRYTTLNWSAVSDGTTTTLSGTVTTYDAGLMPGNTFGLTSANAGLLAGDGGPAYYVQELSYTWQNATTILYTIAFGLTPAGVAPKLAAAFP